MSCLYLPNDDLLQESDHVKKCTPIPDTIKMHSIVQSYTAKGMPCNKFFHLSNDEEPHFVQWCDFAYGHNENEVDENTCYHCLKSYNQNKEWFKCRVCQKWLHDKCFYI